MRHYPWSFKACQTTSATLWQLLVQNGSVLWHSLSHPLVFAVGQDGFNHRASQGLVHNFTNTPAVLAYLVFILLYFPCLSTMAVIAKELNRRWAIFSVVWATVLAYLSAMVVYQLGMFGHHPKQSILVLLSVGLFYGAVIKIARYVLKDKFVPVHQEEAQHAH